MSGSDPLAAALRLLARRGRSEAELGERLRQKGFAEPQVGAALQRCRELGYLNDARFARERAHELMRAGRAVGRRVMNDLRQRGGDEATARAALEAAGCEFGEAELLAELRRRRFPGFAWHTTDDRERQRVVNYFLRRGFPLSLVLSFLQQER